jgi:hypothetical protein
MKSLSSVDPVGELDSFKQKDPDSNMTEGDGKYQVKGRH